MSVLIASSLRKEFSGDPLFDGVSFSVGRRDRLALSGANGAGKTTLLRAIAGETSLQGGELAFAKGTRVALHDQRPPRELGLTLREYALSGAHDLLAAEEELRTLEQAMAGGAHDEGTLRRYAQAQARLEHAGGWAWRDQAASVVRGLGFEDRDLDRELSTFSGGELTRASLARSLAVKPDLLLLDEPTNHLDIERLEWLEDELESLDTAVVLVAHDRWFLESVTTAVLELAPGGAHYFAGPWHEWRLEKAARAAAAERTAERVSEDIARLERFVARFRYKKSKAKQAQAKLTQIGRLEKERGRARGRARVAHARSPHARVRLPAAAAHRTGRARGGGDLALRGRQAAARGRDARPRARREGRARRPERKRQDDAARGDPRPARARRWAREPRPRRHPCVLLPAHAGAPVPRLGARRDRGCDEPARGRRRSRSSAASSSRAGRPTSARSPRSRAASAGGSRSPCSSRRARTSSSSTSRRTTSISRAGRRWRRRSRPSPEPC